MGGVGGGGVQISWAAPDSAAGPRPCAVPRLGPATAPKSLLGRSRAKVTCGGTPGTGADVLVAMESPVSGFSWHRGGRTEGPPPSGWVRGSRVPPRAGCAAPSPSLLLDPLGTGAFPRPPCVPPPSPGSVPKLGGGRGGQGGEANSCFVSEGMGEAEMAASRLRASRAAPFGLLN